MLLIRLLIRVALTWLTCGWGPVGPACMHATLLWCMHVTAGVLPLLCSTSRRKHSCNVACAGAVACVLCCCMQHFMLETLMECCMCSCSGVCAVLLYSVALSHDVFCDCHSPPSRCCWGTPAGGAGPHRSTGPRTRPGTCTGTEWNNNITCIIIGRW